MLGQTLEERAYSVSERDPERSDLQLWEDWFPWVEAF